MAKTTASFSYNSQNILDNSYNLGTYENMTMWLDSSDLSTITKDVNDKVETWVDKAGNVSYTQSNLTYRPTWTNNGILFNASIGECLADSNTNYFQKDMTIILVVRPVGAQPGVGSNGLIFAKSRYVGGTPYTIFATPGPNIRMFVKNVNGGLTYTDNVTVCASFAMTNKTIVYKNKVYGMESSTYTKPTNTENNHLGSHNDDRLYRPYNGYINEIMIFDRILSTIERNQYESALIKKWNIV